MKTFDFAVIGNWHLAAVTAGVLASHRHQVMWVNHEGEKYPWENFPKVPVHEPGLHDRFLQARALENLEHANEYTSWYANTIWIAIDTPVDDHDRPDLKPLEAVLKKIKENKNSCQRVIVSSQVPLGFCREAEKFLNIPVLYVPENLRLGKGIETFERADRTVIGASNPVIAEQAKEEVFKGFGTKFLVTNLETAEMVKHATNAFLATSISFANQMALIGEAYGVDNFVVGKALKMDLRIGPSAYVMPGLGFAGGTLPRDLRVLKDLASRRDLDVDLIEAVLEINENTTKVLQKGTEDHLKLNPGSVLILGYTYKADTDTLRRSLSIDIAKALHQKGTQVLGYDPMMNGKDISAISSYLTPLETLSFEKAPSVILLMTPRSQFKEIDFSKLGLSKNTLLLDAHGFFNADEIVAKGLTYKALWSPAKGA